MKHGSLKLVVVLGALIGGGCTFTTYSTPGSAPASDMYGYQSGWPDLLGFNQVPAEDRKRWGILARFAQQRRTDGF